MSLTASLMTTSRMQHVSMSCEYWYLQNVFLFLYHCCILSEIKLTTTTTTWRKLHFQLWNYTGPCITNVFATRRKNFSQWYRSFQRKLLSLWLKFLGHVAITLVIQGPELSSVSNYRYYSRIHPIIFAGLEEWWPMIWKCFQHYQPFVWDIHWLPVDSPERGL